MEVQREIGEFSSGREALRFGPKDAVSAAVAAMRENKSDAVLVCEADQLRGIFTQRDFLNRVAVVGKSDGELGEVMTSNPDVLGPEDSVMKALHRMAVGNYRNVPIVDSSGAAVGNLSVWDVMQHLGACFEAGADPIGALGEATVEAAHPRPAVEVSPSDRLLDLISLMTQRACGGVLVLDSETPVGIFTERDLMFRVDYSSSGWHDVPVAEVMIANPTCSTLGATVAEALAMMNQKGFRHLPVVDPGRDAAMLSIREILSYVASKGLAAS